ncbi:integrin-linked kinase [Columba livia]|uniref:Integrin-linked kinase n=1 Tax=Columba livia TaxID=8932 RepID=A0A2I0LHP8_COLLI|nr:integrin-linked kinase [Columba livia]
MNRGDDTPLHLAASHGHRDIVQKLIQFKADINAVNEHGNTPLHYACFWGHDQLAEDLVGNGALVSIANKYGETPIDKAKTPLREVLRDFVVDQMQAVKFAFDIMADVKFSFQCPGRMYAPAWVAPEALQKKPEEINRRSADMWSFAVLLWELVTREVPFADLSNMEIGMKVALEGLRPTIPPGISPHICKLMKICMNEDPAKRPKFDMIVPILEKMQEK